MRRMRVPAVRGTRFRLYPQWNEGWTEPETVTVSCPLGSLGPGPSGAKLYAILPWAKAEPYDPPAYAPPYDGACLPPAMPGPAGDFDHIPTDSPQFLAAHLYGCVRRTLDVWEMYLGRAVTWWHTDVYKQLELGALVEWNNAQSGPGFIEMGVRPNKDGVRQFFALNFDVVAHETGHTILFAEIGVPQPDQIRAQFLAFHESFSDLVALVAALHFPSVADRLLAQTAGNLYVLNLISRIGEMSEVEQIRIADNTVTMGDVEGLRLLTDGTWYDPIGEDRNAHALAQPLTGAIFDLFVEMYQAGLDARGALPPGADARQWTPREAETHLPRSRAAMGRAMAAFGDAFHGALADARDVLGACMAHVIRTIEPGEVTFDAVAALILEAAAARGCGRMLPELMETFLLRGIDPRPVLRTRRGPSPGEWRRLPYAERARRMAAAHGVHGGRGCRCGAGSFMYAQRLIRHPHRAEGVAPYGSASRRAEGASRWS
jgi:hypothetical protein